MPIVWTMPITTAERYVDLNQRLQNYEITDEEFAEELATLPGFPLKRGLLPGDDLRIQVLPTATSLPTLVASGD